MLVQFVCGTKLQGKIVPGGKDHAVQKDGVAEKADFNLASTLQKALTVEDAGRGLK